MSERHSRRALVIGGSMSGLFACILLRQAGWEADIFERVAVPLSGRGAGIVTHAELWATMEAAGVDPTNDLGIEIARRQVLNVTGRVMATRACRQVVTSWDRLYSMLRDVFPPRHYHVGRELMHVEENGGGLTAHFADGGQTSGELLVAADGFRSTVRAQCLPEVTPEYAGYVAWRGLVAEQAVSPATHARIFDQMVFCLPPGEQFLGYPVAGPENDLRPGHRRYNWVWYRPAEEVGELRRLLTDSSGHTHAISIPPPLVHPVVVDELRAAARDLLAAPLREMVDLAPQPFLQPIYDVEATRMACGRIAILGDAAFLARPHVGAGVTKAADDALALVCALQSNADVASALAGFERARIDMNRRITRQGRDLGSYLQPNLGPEERASAEQHRTPEAVLRDIAVLDFLRS